MSASRHCPACASYVVGFTAQATPNDPELIEVVAQCRDCKYMFMYHFDFEEMLSEEMRPAEDAGSDQTAQPLQLVGGTDNSGSRSTRR